VAQRQLFARGILIDDWVFGIALASHGEDPRGYTLLTQHLAKPDDADVDETLSTLDATYSGILSLVRIVFLEKNINTPSAQYFGIQRRP
jgi:hypothetical protein